MLCEPLVKNGDAQPRDVRTAMREGQAVAEPTSGDSPPSAELAEALLAEVVADHVNVRAGELRLRFIPTGKKNTTAIFFVEGGPEPLVLRIGAPDDPSQMLFSEYRMMRREPAIHARIQTETSVPVPRIVAADFSRRRIARDYLLISRLPGESLDQKKDVPEKTLADIWRCVAHCLREIHGITGQQYGYVGEHQPMTPQADWASAFHVIWNKQLDALEQCSGYTAEESTYLRRFLDSKMQLFEHGAPAALLHMDVRGQNILVDEESNLIGLIDWDRALWGDPEMEFSLLAFHRTPGRAFLEGYGKSPDSSAEFRTRAVFYRLAILQRYIFSSRVRWQNIRQADALRRQSLKLAHEHG